MKYTVIRRTFAFTVDYESNLSHWLNQRAEDGLELVAMAVDPDHHLDHIFVFKDTIA